MLQTFGAMAVPLPVALPAVRARVATIQALLLLNPPLHQRLNPLLQPLQMFDWVLRKMYAI